MLNRSEKRLPMCCLLTEVAVEEARIIRQSIGIAMAINPL